MDTGGITRVCVQDLLQLQYEEVSVMKMFDKAKVNVNLLIFLLNKKFFNKWMDANAIVFILHSSIKLLEHIYVIIQKDCGYIQNTIIYI